MAFSLGTTAGTGTITIAAGGTVVTGIGTNFQATNVGAIIVVGSQWGVIATRTSTTSITIDRPFTTAVTASAYQISANIPIITQTGTDTSLATLTGVPGVTVSTNLWTITSATLVINGSLTINRLINRLRFLNPANLVTSAVTPPTFTIGATGSFNNSVVQTGGSGYIYRSPNYSIMFDGVIPALAATTASLIGTLTGSISTFEGNIEFANLLSNAVLTFNFEGTTTLQNGALLNSSAVGNNILFYVATGTSNLTINNYTSVGVSLRIANNALTISNYAATAGANAININTTSAINNAQYVGLQSLGNISASIRTAATSLKYFQLINYSDTLLVPTTSLASNIGSQTLIVNQLRLTASGAAENIPNVKFYAKDSNNGSRSPTNYGVGQAYEIATTGDLIYQTTTVGTGIAPTLNVISVIYWQPTASTTTIDYRGNNGAQDLNIYQCAYNYVLSNSLTNLWPLNNGVYGGTQVRNQPFVLLRDTEITEQVMATVAAYTTINNNAKLYDFAKYYLYTNFAGQTATYITGTGDAGSYNIIINQSAVNPFTPSASSLAIKSANFTGDLTTTGSVILVNGSIVSDNVVDAPNVLQDIPTNLNGVIITGNLTFNTNTPITVTFNNCDIQGTISNTGSAQVNIVKENTGIGTVGNNVIAQQFATISSPNLLSGTRVRIYDEDNGVEMFNGVLLSAGFNQSFSYTVNKTVTLTATYTNGVTAKLGISATGIFTESGVIFLINQQDDVAYNTYAINGSTVTGFTSDYVNDEINLTTANNYAGNRLYAWWIYNTTTEEGIRNFFGGIIALDIANLEIQVPIVNIYLDNTTSTFVYQTDTIRIFRSDGTYPARTVTSGGGGIDVNWNNNVYVGTANITELENKIDLVPENTWDYENRTLNNALFE